MSWFLHLFGQLPLHLAKYVLIIYMRFCWFGKGFYGMNESTSTYEHSWQGNAPQTFQVRVYAIGGGSNLAEPLEFIRVRIA